MLKAIYLNSRNAHLNRLSCESILSDSNSMSDTTYSRDLFRLVMLQQQQQQPINILWRVIASMETNMHASLRV